ncbi:MAG TPA: sodium:calcium antiporter [Aquifex aeolicus]|uniref:Sodium:calcium antiporter n=1 Tax=Aquifex aeolicus TaxID=63363 RepID=A0A9D1CFS1_AQUAO|nr:sodium:calcium antiporter [Aquificales bacterium]HIP86019.1 sodium:calcium antiporter [Aquifex sp.]HIP98726.1 sodium:calcium antiporter [Aquifex aeolicus]HIQ25916.1 sodium:calcium antiporter [Aquifex aeolicus]
MDVFLFFASFVGILLAAEFFTNAVEDLGNRLNLSHGVAGSLLAAVGTALPETLVPIVALLFGSPSTKEHIANGAILGAPFMLATLGFLIIGVASILRGDKVINTDTFLIKRDLTFFTLFFPPAIMLAFLEGFHIAKFSFAVILLVGYAYYIYHVLKKGGDRVESEETLHFSKYLKMPESFLTSAFQLLSSLLVLFVTVEIFVHSLENLSQTLGITPLVFSLLVAPVATELPEKFNSFFWSLKGKYELAFGNITGAMVFQSTIPVSVGLIFTEWDIGRSGIIAGFIALLGSLLVLYQIRFIGKLYGYLLLLNGLLYLLYMFFVL